MFHMLINLFKVSSDTGQEVSAGDYTQKPSKSSSVCSLTPIPYGGQAVLEGVMMKGKSFAAIALKSGDGSVEVYDLPLKSSFPQSITNAPFVRGFFLLWDMMGLGMRALNLSADRFAVTHLGEEETAKKNKFLEAVIIGFSLLLAIFIFKALPTWIVDGLGNLGVLGTLGDVHGGIGALLAKNLIEGIVRLSIFVGYILLVSRLNEIKRVFEYHGAEHTVINAHEKDQNNHNLEYITGFDTLHPRCGTSFIVIMVVLMIILMSIFDAIIVTAFYPTLSWPPLWLRLISRVAVIPILSGVSYEIIKNAYKFRHIKLVDWFLAFGMSFQRLTTRKPDVAQLECALASLMRVRQVEENLDISDVPFRSEIKWLGEPPKPEQKIEKVV